MRSSSVLKVMASINPIYHLYIISSLFLFTSSAITAPTPHVVRSITLSHCQPTLTRTLFSLVGGVEVGESIVHAADGQWKRVYRIRLLFEDLVKIKQTFGVDFDVSVTLFLRLVLLFDFDCCANDALGCDVQMLLGDVSARVRWKMHVAQLVMLHS